MLIDRILGLIALLVLAAAASGLAWRYGLPLDGMQYVWLALVGFTCGLLFFLRCPETLTRMVRSILADRLQAVQLRAAEPRRGGPRFAQEPRESGSPSPARSSCRLLLILFYICTARSLSVPFPLLAASVIVPISLAVQMVPLSINGFGVREAVFAFFFTSLGLNVSSALTLSLGSAMLIMLFSLSGGAVFLMRPRRTRFPPQDQTAELT